MTNGTPTRGLSPRSLAGVTGLTSVGMKRNMLGVGLALLALLALLVVALMMAGLLVAPRAHADRAQDNVYFNGLDAAAFVGANCG